MAATYGPVVQRLMERLARVAAASSSNGTSSPRLIDDRVGARLLELRTRPDPPRDADREQAVVVRGDDVEAAVAHQSDHARPERSKRPLDRGRLVLRPVERRPLDDREAVTQAQRVQHQLRERQRLRRRNPEPESGLRESIQRVRHTVEPARVVQRRPVARPVVVDDRRHLLPGRVHPVGLLQRQRQRRPDDALGEVGRDLQPAVGEHGRDRVPDRPVRVRQHAVEVEENPEPGSVDHRG